MDLFYLDPVWEANQWKLFWFVSPFENTALLGKIISSHPVFPFVRLADRFRLQIHRIQLNYQIFPMLGESLRSLRQLCFRRFISAIVAANSVINPLGISVNQELNFFQYLETLPQNPGTRLCSYLLYTYLPLMNKIRIVLIKPDSIIKLNDLIGIFTSK